MILILKTASVKRIKLTPHQQAIGDWNFEITQTVV